MTTTPQHDDAPSTLGRRALLRRAGTVVAVAGGAAAVAAATSGTAEATTGSPVVAGAANTADAGTSLAGSGAGAATLTLSNSSAARAPLALADSGAALATANIAMDAGSLFNAGGDLYYTGSTDVFSQAMVHTDAVTNQIVPILPVRALDTRTVAGRSHLADLSTLDSAGRMKSGAWAELDLSFLALYADIAFLNVTVTGSLGGGFVALSPTGVGAPATSTLNYGKGATLANAAVAPLSADVSVFIWVNVTTHVIIDVGALNSSPSLVTADAPFVMTSAARRELRTRALARASALRAGG